MAMPHMTTELVNHAVNPIDGRPVGGRALSPCATAAATGRAALLLIRRHTHGGWEQHIAWQLDTRQPSHCCTYLNKLLLCSDATTVDAAYLGCCAPHFERH